jgi:hypothetical protein
MCETFDMNGLGIVALGMPTDGKDALLHLLACHVITRESC